MNDEWTHDDVAQTRDYPMPDQMTNGANPDKTPATTSKHGASTDVTAASAARVPAEVGGVDPGPRVSRARARTVPARPEPSPDAMPSAESAFASSPAKAARQAASTSTANSRRSGDGAADVASADSSVAASASADAEIVRGAVGRLDGRTVGVTQGAVGAARAESLSLEMSAVGAAVAGEATISRSIARAVLAREVHLEQAAAQTILAERVTMESGSMALVVFARRVEGEIRPLLDWRGGLAFGAALGVVLAILRPRRRRG